MSRWGSSYCVLKAGQVTGGFHHKIICGFNHGVRYADLRMSRLQPVVGEKPLYVTNAFPAQCRIIKLITGYIEPMVDGPKATGNNRIGNTDIHIDVSHPWSIRYKLIFGFYKCSLL